MFEALEEVTGAGGQRRVRMARGWVSMTSGTGKPLCVGEAAVQEFLSSVPLLQGLDEAERAKIAEVLEAVEVNDEMPIVTEGEEGDAMYFLEDGQAAAEKYGSVVMEYGRGDWFGELALLTNAPRSATVRAVGRARCLKLGRSAFDVFASQCTAVMEQRAEAYNQIGETELARQQEEQAEA